MSRRKLVVRKEEGPKLKAVFVPEGGGWCVSIPSVPGCRAEGRSLSEARRHIREALATCVDVYGDAAEQVARDAEFEADIRLPRDAKAALARARRARAIAEKHELVANQEREGAARALLSTIGLSLRDAGELLGLSHERVKQITSGAK